MKTKSIVFTLAYLLLLYGLAVSAMACCDPPCGECYECIDEECVWVGCDPPCGPCHDCNAITCECDNQCDPCDCETCVDGSCKVCGGDPNKRCCDGSCCDKVWTKRMVTETISPCSPCGSGGGEGLCSGTTTELESYWMCDNVGVGQGEHCQCESQYLTVGYTYPCMINWDCDFILYCAGYGAWCAIVECLLTGFEPSVCALCLMEASAECCGGGPCEICDFVEACEKNPYYREPQKSMKFVSFGC